MLCFRILYLNRILKQSKKTYYVEEEIPNRKMKMKTTKKNEKKTVHKTIISSSELLRERVFPTSFYL